MGLKNDLFVMPKKRCIFWEMGAVRCEKDVHCSDLIPRSPDSPDALEALYCDEHIIAFLVQTKSWRSW